MSNLKTLPVNTPSHAQQSVSCFLSGNTGTFGSYVATANALVYREIQRTQRDTYELKQDICAIRINTSEGPTYIGNSSVLPLLTKRGQTEVQAILTKCIPMLPFTAFIEAKLDLLKAKVVHKGPEEEIKRKQTKYNSKTKQDEDIFTPEHFIGASLFQVEHKYFLFDIDRNEIQHGIINPFIVELPGPAESIQAAYDMLKPQEVKDAESQGVQVKRQGEWFFIPVDSEYDPVKNDRGFIRGTLQAGDNRPNYVEKFFGKVQETRNRWGRNEISVEYVTGKVEHSGREHNPIVLQGWHKPVPNTSVKSFTLTGDVD